MAWTVDAGSSSLNSLLVSASTNMEDELAKEKELEEALYRLKLDHMEDLARKKMDQEKQIMQIMIKNNRIVNDTDYKNQRASLTKNAELKAKLEIEAEQKKNKYLSKKQETLIKNKYAAELKAELKNLDKKYAADKKYRDKLEREQLLQIAKQNKETLKADLFGSGKTFKQRRDAVRTAYTNDKGERDWSKGLAATLGALSDLTTQLDQQINSIAGRKSIIDTRLQGSKNKTRSAGQGNSYWDAISADITGAAAISPFVKQSDIANSVESMVRKGISYNVEERAFLAAIKDKIADTFEATHASLTRLVRIQQQDTTAARLGMESALTSFLNNMYETTEYMSEIATSIKSSIEEASALMGATNAVEFEYQVQKWMGSLYSVGMSSGSVQNIASALGQLAAGDINALSGDAGKLLMMAANNSGMSIADMLAKGLDDTDVNNLMNAAVKYLAEIANETSDSLVVQQQLANVYGLKASDLRAAKSLSSSLNAINTNGLSYNGAMQQLYNMAGTMWQRTSIGEMLTNTWDNTKYSMAGGIANNPALYGIYKIAGLLDSVAGGIALPDIKVMGTGVNLQTSVADLMRVTALSGGILSSMGQLIAAGNGGGITGSGLLNAFGVGKGTSVQRGTGGGLITSGGASVSSSGYIGNSSGGDIIGKTTADANAEGQNQLNVAQEETEEITNKTIDEHIINIYTLLQNVVTGTSALNVKINTGNPLTNLMFNTNGFN